MSGGKSDLRSSSFLAGGTGLALLLGLTGRWSEPLLQPARGGSDLVGNMGDSTGAGSRNVEAYEKVEQVGEGTYG